MTTVKQRTAFHKMVENGGVASTAMISANYSPATAKTPQKLTESKGFQELCNEYGLTDDFLVKALVDDIDKKPKNRKAELELAFKIKGRMDDKPENTRPINLIIPIQVSQSFNIQQDEEKKDQS